MEPNENNENIGNETSTPPVGTPPEAAPAAEPKAPEVEKVPVAEPHHLGFGKKKEKAEKPPKESKPPKPEKPKKERKPRKKLFVWDAESKTLRIGKKRQLGTKGVNRLVLTLGALALALLLVLSILGLAGKARAYSATLDLGERFLDAGSYREAVLAFNAAIYIEPRAKAYLGRGDANAALGDFSAALSDYQAARERRPYNKEAYARLAATYLEMGDRGGALEILRTAYQKTHSRAFKTWRQLLESESGTASLSGVVSGYLPYGDTSPLSGATVRLYRTISKVDCLVAFTSTASDGGFTLENLPAGKYTLCVDEPTHIGVRTEQTVEDGEQHYTELFLLIPQTDETRYGAQSEGISLQVTNALNGESVANARLTLRSGWNNEAGRSLLTAQTDEYGAVQLDELDYGYYTVYLEADEYLPAYHNVAVLPEEYVPYWQLSLSPVLKEGETRVVLTWSATPADLDSHLRGDDFHVWYSGRSYDDSLGRHRADLDLDDTNGYGPETISIYQGVDGTYTYSVYDFSNGGNAASTALGASGAMVRVYQGDGLAATYRVPTGQAGTTWTVFTLDSRGRITPVNTISSQEP